eukprot:TRINITY_DN65260_c0_g2_i1.p1 TRINITY_DN65260_c0_g2~~TRINITY_DN65260_c0_g2_i1.p1  ORF type:complete len:166 (-),score=106.35 TRINITY_DN65260_c0_g2_i1:662-1129(-)
MVVKTDTCFYTDYKVYPGHGSRFVRKDGKLLTFLNRKATSLYKQGIKAQRLTWTSQWRRRHKKGNVEAVQRRKVKKSTRVFKSITGLTLDDLRKKRAAGKDARKASNDAHLRAIKERKRKQKEDRKKAASYNKKAQSKGYVKQPKSRRNIGGNRR